MMTSSQRNNYRSLADLIAWDRELNAVFGGIAVAGLQLDSRAIAADEVFVACKGANQDGRDFVREAVARGAVAVLAEADEEWSEDRDYDGVPVLVIDQLGHKLSKIAGCFYGLPSEQLPLIGVTGTNGKTSCTQLMAQLLASLGKRCGVLGTLGNGINQQFKASANTTPDAITIQGLLAQWLDVGVDTVAMEVSSHGLAQGRVAELQFDVAVFTNLSRDHLDYHGSMQAYGEAKLKLFRQAGLELAVVNLDDDFADAVLAATASKVKQLTYSLKQTEADIYIQSANYAADGVDAVLQSPWGEYKLHSPLLGDFNLSNLLAALTALAAKGYAMADLIAGCATLKPVMGRMERVASGADIEVVVDYAHTPAALENALAALRMHTKGQLWCVFGCGGDRDKGKRPQMGRIAEQLADHVVVTSDNPRSENAETILNDILAGITNPSLVEADRAKAITSTIARAAAGDSILLAGKGHEDYQQVGDQRLPFSDIEQARLAVRQRQAGGQP